MPLAKQVRVGPFPFPKSTPEERRGNFTEVEQPYTRKEAMLEADRCVRCGNPVCIDICPVHLDVRGMCDAVANGDFTTAYRRIRETNCLLGVTARCCPQMQGLCEDACVLHYTGQPISIGMIQRFISDWEKDESRQTSPEPQKETGKRVTVIGAGPAGLAAAELLRRYGHSVTIYDELPKPGGTALYGIPDYHLPKDILSYEAERVAELGIDIRCSVKVGRDVQLSDLLSESDAVLVATGSKDVVKLDTPGIDLDGVIDGYLFLENVFVNGVEAYLENPAYSLGRDILVIGGGDSALDCARTAIRLSGGNVTVVYRRTESEMPSDPVVIDEAREEGVQFKWLTSPVQYNGEKGRLRSVTMSVMQLGPPDESGRRSPQPVPGQDFEMKCDTAVIAVGRGPNSSIQRIAGLRTGRRNAITVDDHYLTSMHGVYAAGDVITGESLVVKAMGHGREAAQRIHEFLMNLEKGHVSLYERYFMQRTSSEAYEEMLSGKYGDALPP